MRNASVRRKINNLKKHYSSSLNFRRRRRKFQAEKARYYGVFAAEVAGVIILAFLVVETFGIRVSVAGESMAPTVENGNTVLLNKASYFIGGPKTNDVIAFYPAGNVNAKCSVKRVIGVPGDTILIQNGTLYVNGEVFEDIIETYSMSDSGLAATEITLKDDEYFVLGDNRNNSEDSRYETIKNVTKDEIAGKVWMCVSFHNFGSIE